MNDIVLYVILSVIVLVVLYKLFVFKIATFVLERKISKMRPSIITYLDRERKYWQEKLKKFDENDVVVRTAILDRSIIIENIENIDKDLEVDNKYQILKEKFRKRPRSQLGLAHNYARFLVCLDYFRGSSNVDPNFSIRVGEKKQYIYKVFEELLNA